ncbi:MAG TPA: HAMP domain-containing sensor histidine kinase [Mobilitalea sp.]|nr:HAMP domain-containing sensor histidine kinase [Mobilitalea sp.]
MFSEYNNDALACMIRSYPELETVIQNIITDNKRTTSMFVHELRNPLSLLKGTIQYIETKHPETKEFKYWSQMQELVSDLEHMMADASLLNAYNILNKDTTDLIALVNNIKNSFMPQASNQQIDLVLTVEPGCEEFFQSYSCDAIKLKQAVSNLIKNAFEATSQGNSILITMAYLPGEEQIPPKLSIQISNNGYPIPEDEIDNIFTPFVTYKKGGTGVGLAIVKRVIDLHYGSISVNSNEELTTFTLLLPL